MHSTLVFCLKLAARDEWLTLVFIIEKVYLKFVCIILQESKHDKWNLKPITIKNRYGTHNPGVLYLFRLPWIFSRAPLTSVKLPEIPRVTWHLWCSLSPSCYPSLGPFGCGLSLLLCIVWIVETFRIVPLKTGRSCKQTEREDATTSTVLADLSSLGFQTEGWW